MENECESPQPRNKTDANEINKLKNSLIDANSCFEGQGFLATGRPRE
jgi:hypothetical protein